MNDIGGAGWNMQTGQPWQQTGQEYNSKMKRLYTSNYIEMAGYLMDFGFGGFIGYGKGVSVGLVMEELNIRMRYY